MIDVYLTMFLHNLIKNGEIRLIDHLLVDLFALL